MILSHEGTWFMLLSHIQPIKEKNCCDAGILLSILF